MSRVKIPRDLQLRLRAFQRAKGLTSEEIGEILNVDMTASLTLVFGIDVPDYVVDGIERLVASQRFDIVDHAEAVAEIAVRFGVAEKAEILEHGRGVILHSGYFVDGVRLLIVVPARAYLPAMARGDAEAWRFLRTYVAGYVAASLEAARTRKAVAA